MEDKTQKSTIVFKTPLVKMDLIIACEGGNKEIVELAIEERASDLNEGLAKLLTKEKIKKLLSQ